MLKRQIGKENKGIQLERLKGALGAANYIAEHGYPWQQSREGVLGAAIFIVVVLAVVIGSLISIGKILAPSIGPSPVLDQVPTAVGGTSITIPSATEIAATATDSASLAPSPKVKTKKVKVLFVMIDGLVSSNLDSWIDLEVQEAIRVDGTCGIKGLEFTIPPGTRQVTLIRYDTPSITRIEVLPPTEGNLGTVVIKPYCILGDKFSFITSP